MKCFHMAPKGQAFHGSLDEQTRPVTKNAALVIVSGNWGDANNSGNNLHLHGGIILRTP